MNNSTNVQQVDNKPLITVLSDAEIKTLSEKSAIKSKFRWLFLGLGLALFIIAILFYVLAWTVEGFVIEMTYDHETFGLNLSIVFGSLLLTLSLLLMSQVWGDTSKYRENSFFIPKLMVPRETPKFKKKQTDRKYNEIDHVQFRHFATSRFIAAVLILVMASINMSVFGTAIDEENHIGSWFFLGGPSMFSPMSAFMFLVAIGLLFYTVFSIASIRFTSTEHFYLIEEYRMLMPWMTEVPKDKIQAIRITNAKTGPKYFWIILAAFNLILCFTDGTFFLTNPFAFGAGLIVGRFYIMTGIVHLVAICILLFKHQYMLEIVTEEKRYELYFSPPKSNLVKDGIESVFNLENRKEKSSELALLNKTQLTDWQNLVTGVGFILFAIISHILYRGAGNPLRIVLYIFGFILIVRGIKEDFTKKDGLNIYHNKENSTLSIRKKFCWFESAYRFEKCTEENFKIDFRLRKLDFFDILMGLSFGIVLGLDFGTFGYFVPIDSLAAGMKIFHTILVFLLLIYMIALLIKPTNKLMLNIEDLHYEFPIPGIVTHSQAKLTENMNPFQNIFYRWKDVLKNQQNAFVYRVLLIIEAFLLGLYFFGRYVALPGYWITALIFVILIPAGLFGWKFYKAKKGKIDEASI
ncbi:MAG: hypothetical protein E4G98_01940 [Promethearchaeota archaeon]|nr:MAG: hypothetical protein E4G98_01940 [Candidatus Lokiarchaeota archaeon]